MNLVATPSVRAATLGDAEAIAEIYGEYVLNSPASFEVVPPSASEMRQRMAGVMETHPWLVYEGPSGVVGYAYASRHRERLAYQWSVDVSAYVALGHHRTGIGRALYGPLLATVRAQGFRNAFAGITLPNSASVGLHQAMGFGLVGIYSKVGFKLGQWHDTSWWQLSFRDDEAEPAELLAWRRVLAIDGK